MALPINIDDLIHGQTVEWERLEFKQGWNPEDIIHSMCAFANDLHNWGGGYIIIGIAEKNGQPILPPTGLQQNQLDNIQGEIIKLAHKILPNYFPICQPYVLQGKHILVLWCPAGDNRPYTAPSTLGANGQRHPYVRVGSRSIIARGVTLTRLQELTARIPFDDRVNNQATINDFDLATIQAYLQEVKSDLYAESTKLTLEELCRTMHIAKGATEDIRPVNVGLLFFSKEPHNFFPRTWIELVWHQDDSGKKFKEYYFKGPLHEQLKNVFSFLQSNIIGEQVMKAEGRALSARFNNYPFNAIEEVISNAVYHKSYELGSPIEIQVWKDKIEILSFPGPVPPVNAEILSTQKRIVAREYRNRRIGDFLKELRLTEGRGTGFPTIYKAMEENGSPEPIFKTDEQSTYVLVTLPVHPLSLVSDQASDQAANQVKVNIFSTLDDIIAFTNGATNQVSDQVSDLVSDQVKSIVVKEFGDKILQVLEFVEVNDRSRVEILAHIGLTNHTKNKQKYIDPLLNIGWLALTIPENPKDRNQKYKLTNSGKLLFQLINH
ncbi:RNA-binding domain-containing protein [Lutibacter sp.]